MKVLAKDNKVIKLNNEVLSVSTVLSNIEVCDDCLTWSAPEAFSVAITGGNSIWDVKMEISFNKIDWREWDGTTIIQAQQYGGIYRFFMRGTGNNFVSAFPVGGLTHHLM